MRKFIDVLRESREERASTAFPVYPDDAWRFILTEALNEYETIPDVDFDQLSFVDGDYIGNINTGMGLLKVFRLQFGAEVIFGAGKSQEETMAELTVEYLGSGLAMMRTVSTSPEARGKGVASELALFVHAVLGITILNDTQMSSSGERLRDSLIRSGHFEVRIYDAKTAAFHDVSEIGGPAGDGSTILHPREDDADSDMWSTRNPAGQRFFWALKAKQKFDVVAEGVNYRYGVSRLRHRPGPSHPPRYFFGEQD